MTPSLRLAELLCARLCHELSSPLGTLAGVMEMLTDGGSTAVEARNVADEASVAVRARLRLLRAAWSGDCGPMQADEIRTLVEGLRASRRVRVELDGLTGTFSGQSSRLILNLLMMGVEAVAGNGVIRLNGSATEGVAMALEGPRAAWPDDFVAGVADEAEAWGRLGESRALQAPFTAIIAHADGLHLSFADAAEGVPAELFLRAVADAAPEADTVG